MLKTQSAKAPKKADDGFRILVMRPRKNEKMPDPSITPDMFDAWWKELGAPPKLISAYCKGEISWNEYAKKFHTYLRLPYIQPLLRGLIKLAHKQNITILCIEDTPEHCHRRLIAERCKELDSSLHVCIE